MCGLEDCGGGLVYTRRWYHGMIFVSGRSEVGLVDARRDLYLRGRRRPVRNTAAHEPARNAYGSCVFTWSIVLTRHDAADSTVVSEIGEQWSPQTAPPRIAPAQFPLDGRGQLQGDALRPRVAARHHDVEVLLPEGAGPGMT